MRCPSFVNLAVITTYSVLQSETNYVDLPHSNSAEGRRFRNPKRFMAIAAPLPCVQGGKLQIRQMVEVKEKGACQMVVIEVAKHLLLNAENTGWPLWSDSWA